MEELDLLKQHWNKQADFPHKSKVELHKIIKRSSSNTLKWMIAANIFELCLILFLGIFLGSTESKISMDIESNQIIFGITKVLDVLLIGLPILFSLIYFYMIRQIHVTDSIADLLTNILRARKLLNIYIYINIFIFLLILCYSLYYSFNSEEINNIENIEVLGENGILIIKIVSSIFSFAIFIGGIWLFYKLLYGKLLKRLKRNINDLDGK